MLSSGGVPPTLGEAVDKDILVSVLRGGERESEQVKEKEMENGHVAIHNSKSRINMSVVYKNSIF